MGLEDWGKFGETNIGDLEGIGRQIRVEKDKYFSICFPQLNWYIGCDHESYRKKIQNSEKRTYMSG